MVESSKKSSNSGSMHLSYEIVFMILVRLPSKSLLQLKSVCSLWRSLISDPHFIKAHLDTANNVHNLRLIRNCSVSSRIQSIGLKDDDKRFDHTTPKTVFSSNIEILGSCNGLLVLGDYDHTYYLWNPSTSLLREFNGPSIFRGQFRNFGLGYDSSSNAYKFVRIVRVSSQKPGLRAPRHTNRWYDATSVNVYNCKTDCWKKIDDFPYVIFEDAKGVTMNGFIHWVMFRDHHGEDELVDFVIVYFDLVEEKFKEIPKPNWLVRSCEFEVEFGVYEGLLCLVRYYKHDFDAWVMQKYGEESWVNLFSKSWDTRRLGRGWNPARRRDGRFEFGGCPPAFDDATYVESLVSPHGGSHTIG